MRFQVLLLTLSAVLAACGGSPVEPTTPPSPPPPACSYVVSPDTLNFSSTGGTAPVEVKTADKCSWTASASAAWITIASGQSGAGNGTVTCTVIANPDPAPRSGTLTIAGQTVPVSEAALACAYTLSAVSGAFGEQGGGGAFDVVTLPACPWTAAATAAWIHLLSPANGRGTGTQTVSFSVEANPAFTPRQGTITAEGLTFTVSQQGRSTAACAYAVQPTKVERDYRGTFPGSPVSVSVSADAGCPWGASTEVPWLTIVAGRSGAGAGTIEITVAPNYELPRRAPVLVRWPTPTTGQNVWVTEGGCSYAVTYSPQSYTAAGGTGRISVWPAVLPPGSPGGPASCDCYWTVATDVSWISLARTSGCGDNDAAFTVQANTSSGSRSGTITVAGHKVPITQQGR